MGERFVYRDDELSQELVEMGRPWSFDGDLLRLVSEAYRFKPAWFVVVVLALAPTGARADEGGVSFWLPGQYGSLAAMAPAPGFSLPSYLYFYSGDAQSKRTTVGNRVVGDLDATVTGLILQPTYSTETKVLGAQPSFTLGWMLAHTEVDAEVLIDPIGIKRSQSDSLTSGSDLFPLVSLFWSRGVHNWMAYLTGGIPVGDYDANELANIGIGHGAIDAGGAYTYFSPETGREFSATLGFTYNFENPDTNYQNGVDSHLEVGVSQFLSESLHAGLVGYYFQQLSEDSGSGAVVGSFRSRVAGVGPQIGYSAMLGDVYLYLNLRGYWEFEAKNRLEGGSLYGVVAIAF